VLSGDLFLALVTVEMDHSDAMVLGEPAGGEWGDRDDGVFDASVRLAEFQSLLMLRCW
jgi:hypothetical protein